MELKISFAHWKHHLMLETSPLPRKHRLELSWKQYHNPKLTISFIKNPLQSFHKLLVMTAKVKTVIECFFLLPPC